jgi:hypothetical protein
MKNKYEEFLNGEDDDDYGYLDPNDLEVIDDKTWEPSDEEILSYALKLGYDIENDPDELFEVAYYYLKYPLPEGWRRAIYKDTKELMYINMEDGEIEVATEIEEMAHKTYLEKKEEMMRKNGNNFLKGNSEAGAGETKVVPRTKIPPIGSTQKKNNTNNLNNNNVKNEKVNSIGVSADFDKDKEKDKKENNKNINNNKTNTNTKENKKIIIEKEEIKESNKNENENESNNKKNTLLNLHGENSLSELEKSNLSKDESASSFLKLPNTKNNNIVNKNGDISFTDNSKNEEEDKNKENKENEEEEEEEEENEEEESSNIKNSDNIIKSMINKKKLEEEEKKK